MRRKLQRHERHVRVSDGPVRRRELLRDGAHEARHVQRRRNMHTRRDSELRHFRVPGGSRDVRNDMYDGERLRTGPLLLGREVRFEGYQCGHFSDAYVRSQEGWLAVVLGKQFVRGVGIAHQHP